VRVPHSLLRRFGVDVVRWSASTGYQGGLRELLETSYRTELRSGYLAELRTLLDETRPDLLVDVGGNRGEFVRDARASGYRDQIISFEPVAATASALRKRANSDPLWTVETCGLGDRDERRVIQVPAADDLASFLKPTDRGLAVLPHLAETRVETVEVRRLDDVLGDRGTRIFLKVDTQGWDMHVLSGASSVVERVVAVQIELALDPLYKGADDYLSILAWLRRAGFAPTAYFPVLVIGGRVYEVDCLLRRR
jgi:FkbM family methyltransferase